MTLNSYNVIILDCDGVIFNSNLLKVEAFKKALNQYSPDIVEKFSTYFKNNFGTSRYHLAKIFIEEFLNQDFDEDLYQKILKDYGNSCILLYKESEYTYKFINFIQYYKNKKFYIASGGDENELKEVFKEKKIDHYFENIFGSPRKKIDLVAEILLENKEKEIIMIGDAKTDFLASQANDIDFIYMSKYSLVKNTMNCLAKEYTFTAINNLGDLIGE
jgi:HAD superfamily hydrolase (TIGR01549 family)